jgi:hypothetical protein
MWYAIAAAAWWLSAFIPLLMMSSPPGDEGLTWGGLLLLATLSLIGPILGLIIALTIISSFGFWDRPIWPRKK